MSLNPFRISKSLLIILILFSLNFSVSYANNIISKGSFIGLGIQVLEPSGNGEMISSNGRYYEFDFPWYNSYGLVGLTDPGPTGLGWQEKQLFGLRMNAGHRFSKRFLVKSSFTWFLPNSERAFFIPPDSYLEAFVNEQKSTWYQWTGRIAFDYYPVKPIPMWFLTCGAEYSWFSTHLDFYIGAIDRLNPDNMNERKEKYDYQTNSTGFFIGTGFTFPQGVGKYYETSLSVIYSHNMYDGKYFIREGNFDIGGISLEIDVLFYLLGKK